MGTVAAVVVTHNRKHKLEKALAHVLAQTRAPDWIIVVDNASADGTQSMLERYADRVTVLGLPDNRGGAGGFAAGMARAHALGADAVWLMDDDCYANADALAELLAGLTRAEQALNARVAYACSLVKWIDGSICEMNIPGARWDWGRLFALGQQAVLTSYCSFVSLLVPRWVMDRYGLPLKEYFLWFDDREYTQRIGTGGAGVQVLGSVVVHDLEVNRGVDFKHIDRDNLWKYEYGIRNEASYRLHREGVRAYLRFARRVWRVMAKGRVPWTLRMHALSAVGRGARFKPKPDLP